MACAPATNKRRSRRPDLNFYDVPEMLPGARPGAGPVEHAFFLRRCDALRAAEEEEFHANADEAAIESVLTHQQLEAMFPLLDADLVSSIYTEASSPEVGLNMLLALAGSLGEPAAEAMPPPPPVDLGVGDENAFPSLTDADGWQVVGRAQLEREPDAVLGNKWADCAKAAAMVPDRAPAPRKPLGAWGRPQKEKEEETKHVKDANDADQECALSEYDQRHMAGERRIRHRAQFGRGHGHSQNATETVPPPESLGDDLSLDDGTRNCLESKLWMLLESPLQV